MDRISSLLPKVLKKRGLKNQADASLIVHEAEVWLKQNGVTDVKVRKCQDGVLFIETKHSVAAQECHSASHELCAALQKKFGTATPEKVRLLRASTALVE